MSGSQTSPVREELLQLIRCPQDHSRLALADHDLVARLNEAIRQGRIQNVAGDPVHEPIQAGLIREDGQVLYPVLDDIPRLTVDEGIRLDQLNPSPPTG
jgi:uncharacterized protein YbaR (Trm112 family)